jgi:two-component system, OmpR family, sensor histidine kinase KdpD
LSRIEAGALQLQKEWNVLAEIIDNTVARLKRATQHHRLEIDVSEDLPLVQVDAVLLQQVFINLLDNSTKYAPVDTVIRITAHEEGATALLVEVINQGPPVPEEHLQGIFDRFHRVTAADRIPGTGLGLSICKGVIEAHGGRIWAENRADGFAFKFTLPNRLTKSMPDMQMDELHEQRS